MQLEHRSWNLQVVWKKIVQRNACSWILEVNHVRKENPRTTTMTFVSLTAGFGNTARPVPPPSFSKTFRRPWLMISSWATWVDFRLPLLRARTVVLKLLAGLRSKRVWESLCSYDICPHVRKVAETWPRMSDTHSRAGQTCTAARGPNSVGGRRSTYQIQAIVAMEQN